jgi:hypothetical protein
VYLNETQIISRRNFEHLAIRHKHVYIIKLLKNDDRAVPDEADFALSSCWLLLTHETCTVIFN